MNGPVWLVALPLLGAFLLPLIYRRNETLGMWAGPVILLACFSMGMGVWFGISVVGPQPTAMGGFPAPLAIVFYADYLAMLFALSLILLTLVMWLGNRDREQREEVLMLLLVGGGSGLVLSGDLFNIYVFYEIVAVASYGLAASRGTGASYAASLRFLLLGALGSALILLGIALIYSVSGTLNLSHLAMMSSSLLDGPVALAAFVLMLIGFGVKAELFPVNTWVPEVYGAARVRVSALLAGIVSKLALVVILRFLVLIYGESVEAHLILLTLGVLSVISGELAAMRARDLRQVLAYSSIGQLGLVAIAFSIPSPLGIVAGVALAMHHALVKPAMFLLLRNWSGPLGHLRGMYTRAPFAVAMFLILVLSLIGIPPLPGFWAKFALFHAALGMEIQWYHWAVLIVALSVVVETAYFMRIARGMFADQSPVAEATRTRELRPALVLTAVLLIAMLSVGLIGDGLLTLAAQAGDAKVYIQSSFLLWDIF